MTQRIPDRSPRRTPTIYVYSDTSQPGWLKVGYTTRTAEERIREQHPIKEPVRTWHFEWQGEAFYADDSGGAFTDKAVHRMLRKLGISVKDEWAHCSLREVQAAYQAVRHRDGNADGRRTLDFPMRDEQARAVQQTLDYFRRIDDEGRTPHYLWNAKMRFGKTFATYQLALRMKAHRVLVLTFKPAVEAAWRDDLMQHVDFAGWQFFSVREGGDINSYSQRQPLVCFGSFQDLLGVDRRTGALKPKNEWIHATAWDLVVLDEYHFGAWNENARRLFDIGTDDDRRRVGEMNEILEADGYRVRDIGQWDERNPPITASHYLYLSGTPFRALAEGEFGEDQIFNWTYQDEQAAKAGWSGKGMNPYAEMPTMVMMTYQMPDDLQVAARIEQYGQDEFDLNEFFRAEEGRFVHENEVQRWLDILRGRVPIFGSASPDNREPALPYKDARLLDMCSHTMWYLPGVESCRAMYALLHRRANAWYNERYEIVNCSGSEAGIGIEALAPVADAMYGATREKNPVATASIILTCGKLTTGVTLRPLGGILMLRNLRSPESYFQSAFRVQSPWCIAADDGSRLVMKEQCYVFDFAPNRALRQVVNYASRLNIDPHVPQTQKVQEFINFLPILQFDGSSMKEVNAVEILDFVDNGASATLLARRWNSASLVNVDMATLERVMASPEALAALDRIEDFRALGNNVIETIVNRTEKIKALKERLKDADEPEAKRMKRQLTDEERERKSLRKKVQEKLVKFITHVPVFMYLTDYCEECLEDVIRRLEPGLFLKVTGLEIKDFDLLVSLGVFNRVQIDSAILMFRRYEDSSLAYTGMNRHEDEARIGLFGSSVSAR